MSLIFPLFTNHGRPILCVGLELCLQLYEIRGKTEVTGCSNWFINQVILVSWYHFLCLKLVYTYSAKTHEELTPLASFPQ